MEVIIRKALASDVESILELYKQLQPLDPVVDVETAMPVWEQSAKSGVTYFVAEVDKRVIATCYIAIIPNMSRGCSPIGYIENVVTASDFRRRGIGRRLMSAAVEHAKAQGCYKALLKSSKKRTEAHEFYESIGFDGGVSRIFEVRFKT